MRLVADENIEFEIVSRLRDAGHDVFDVKASYPGIDDVTVLELAARQNALLLTSDKDFGELIYRERRHSSGVLLLRFGRSEPAERADMLLTLLAEHAANLAGSFTVVTLRGARIRK